ncbi:MAG: winged helix-turn-helix transcriptional regulator [Armatimonadetes bacterium]|nr:winged helix-turn-helix transcriptional regulator [Armatimonadota bacterium]
MFRGLADPTRLTILQALRTGPLRVVDLSKVTGRAQPNVSGHLACLRDCGLVKASPSGRQTYYSLADEEMLSLLYVADVIVSRIGPTLCTCPRYEE